MRLFNKFHANGEKKFKIKFLIIYAYFYDFIILNLRKKMFGLTHFDGGATMGYHAKINR